ncbi:MAG: hypothetical protein ACLTJG_22220 [[Clostridium] innocuum]
MQLELQNVGYSYNGKELVLRHVNYRFEGGRIYAITGRPEQVRPLCCLCFHS